MKLSILKKHPFIALLSVLASAFTLLNILAYNHAWSMTHFTRGASSTAKPENLDFFEKIEVLAFGITLNRPLSDTTPIHPHSTIHLKNPGGSELASWEIPHPTPKGVILLFHGYGADRSSLLSEASAFHELGFTVFLTDFRGYGGSSENDTTIGIREADDVLTVFNHAHQMHSGLRIILYGSSMGASAVMRAIAVHGVKPDGVIVEAVFDSLLRTVENRFKTMGVPSFPSAQLMLFWADRQMGISTFEHNPVDYASFVRCPTLFLHGRHDPRTTLEDARRVFNAVEGDQKTFVEFPTAGHEPCLHADRALWNQSLRAFLDSHP